MYDSAGIFETWAKWNIPGTETETFQVLTYTDTLQRRFTEEKQKREKGRKGGIKETIHKDPSKYYWVVFVSAIYCWAWDLLFRVVCDLYTQLDFLREN